MLCGSDEDYIKITISLDIALRALRWPDRVRSIWVGINQRDNDEKSRQVRGMSNIYSRAREAAIWIGDECEDASRVLEFLDKYTFEELSTVSEYISYGHGDILEVDRAKTSIEEGIRESFGTNVLEPFSQTVLATLVHASMDHSGSRTCRKPNYLLWYYFHELCQVC